MSRSFANISELQDGNAESAYYRKARLLEEQLKFSSECGLHSEIEGSAQVVLKKMDDLIRESKKLERRGGERTRRWAGQGVESEDQWEELNMEMSLSEPNLIGSQESSENLSKNRQLLIFTIKFLCSVYHNKISPDKNFHQAQQPLYCRRIQCIMFCHILYVKKLA
jgi:hypothetical protein